MFLTMAGAMSTAEIGLSLAEMIRAGKVDAICCTAANLEEDVYNLVAHDHYVRVPNYRELARADEQDLLDRHLNRVTDTCIPEEEAIRRTRRPCWASGRGPTPPASGCFPTSSSTGSCAAGIWTQSTRSIPPTPGSWRPASAPADLRARLGDSTSDNIYTSQCPKGTIANVHTVRTGVDYMMELTAWYQAQAAARPVRRRRDRPRLPDLRRADAAPGHGAPRHPVVELLLPDLRLDDVVRVVLGRGAEREVTWEKLGVDTPRFVIESDATIVAPLVFAYVLAEHP